MLYLIIGVCFLVGKVFTPTEDKDEKEKEEFYERLEEILDTTVGNIKIVLDDFNAKTGKERIYRKVAEVHSLRDLSNDNSSRLANFALGNGLIIKSTMFPRKDIYTNIPGNRQTGDMRTRLTMFWSKTGLKMVQLMQEHYVELMQTRTIR
ncbi:Hypothetical protein CINCED_3A000867 [Cinara cedri]|uniref:Endonuclease/exonuclease/phosphatase n=1 Tax=Cinara cedri TaxID=506608 RepID=A0A5E4M9F7_9HEMI|nr:Hypothetical protein CINCED_3A000867 [Cinara cedri]